MNKFLLFKLILVITLSYSYVTTKDADLLTDEQITAEINNNLDLLGLKDRKEITREEFKLLFLGLMTKNEKIEEENEKILTSIADNYAIKVPERIHVDKIEKYLNLKNLNDVITELIERLDVEL